MPRVTYSKSLVTQPMFLHLPDLQVHCRVLTESSEIVFEVRQLIETTANNHKQS